MVKLMPVLSYHFHLSPADVWALTNDELSAYLDAVGDINAQRQGAG